MQILYELVTVIREQKPINHWETGKMADAVIWNHSVQIETFKPGDLPACCTEMHGAEMFTRAIISSHE